MTVELTPNGTYGTGLPKLPGPLRKTFLFLNVGFFRLLGTRVKPWGTRLVLLTTVGARTGKPRKTTLCAFEDISNESNPRWLVVASSGGSARHPAWYYNLAKHPDRVTIEAAGRRERVSAESLAGAERDEAWESITKQAPNYAGYQSKTDRQIPVVRLTPAPSRPAEIASRPDTARAIDVF